MKMVKSAYRALDVLELLADVPAGYTFTEILQRLELPKSTGHELLKTLASRKYIQFDPRTKLYSLGSRMITLGMQRLQTSEEMQAAIRLAEQLADAVHQAVSVQVGVPAGDEAVVVFAVDRRPNQERDARPLIGARFPLTSSALGKACLSGSSEQEIRHVWRSSTPSFLHWRELHWELKEVRQWGVAFEADEAQGRYRLAVPVRNALGETAAAVSIELKMQTEEGELQSAFRTLSECTGSGIGGTQAANDRGLVFVSLPNFHSQKALAYLQTFEREFELPMLAVTSHDLEWKQQLYLDWALDRWGPSCVILSPVNAANSDSLFREVREKNVPAICFQRPSRSRFVDYFVGGDGYEQGVMQMDYVAKRLKGRGRVLLLEGDPYNDNAHNMSMGHQSVLKQHEDRMQAEFISVPLWSKEETKMIVEEFLDAGAKFDAIIAGTDLMAEGVIEELVKHKQAGKVLVVGGDGDLSAIRLIKARQQHATVYQRPDEAASAAVRIAHLLIRGMQADVMERRPLIRDLPGKEVWVYPIPYALYDASNLNELEKRWTDRERLSE
ncbi:substrate-binding domain-containing protein [Cohnella zeiphila]|uniref:Substrate-binding domain-containing protein n=1 Tax=Cohnella zeiphila TaxID=2761120 RepID=A0A7X0VZY9_9BACL|nr:substrate-binding domain-containing protein [Cohnella zeiphila]MBB6734468.1 substrate-binding domain-containing protein [Cohnella zeiphila]